MNEAIDDAFISALVKTTLLLHRSTNALNATVNTKDGVVAVGGKVLNAAEKDLATKLVRDVHGVRRVVNNMTVAGRTKTAEIGSSGNSSDEAAIAPTSRQGALTARRAKCPGHPPVAKEQSCDLAASWAQAWP